jgi:ribosomal protein S18 acetylase RimI-like enzyme
VDSWRTAYKSIIKEETLAALSLERRQQSWQEMLENPQPGSGLFVAEESAGIVGFVSTGFDRERIDTCQGEIYAIYLLEQAQGRGVGRALMSAAGAHLLALGCTSMLLWVLKDNHPARKFYTRLGGAYLTEKLIQIGTQSLLEVAYHRDDLSTIVKEQA